MSLLLSVDSFLITFIKYKVFCDFQLPTFSRNSASSIQLFPYNITLCRLTQMQVCYVNIYTPARVIYIEIMRFLLLKCSILSMTAILSFSFSLLVYFSHNVPFDLVLDLTRLPYYIMARLDCPKLAGCNFFWLSPTMTDSWLPMAITARVISSLPMFYERNARLNNIMFYLQC